jgi:sRNA-binding regulator protein Hfq
MGWEQFWENISNIGNLSLVIIAVAALLYYFGKLIGDVKVEKYEKTDYYIEGLFFSLIYVALPFVVVLLLTQYANLYIPFWPSLFLQIFILGCLWLSVFANEYLKRHGLLSRFKKLSRETIEQLKRKHRFVATAEEKVKNSTKKDLTELYSLAFYKIPIKVFGNTGVLFLFSFIILWCSYSSISPETALLPSTIFLSILTFVNLTFLALTFGYANAYYPPAKIILENGNEINGKVLKFGEFVYLLKENEEKKLFINKDKIVYVEESLYKEKTEDDELRGV